MKRVANTQLVKDSDDMEEDVEEVGKGFKKADDAVLATRKIRSLPKRAGTTTTTTPAAATAFASSNDITMSPKLTTFTGFDSTSASPFPANPQPMASTSTTSAPLFTSSFNPAPAIAATASKTAKTFASFLGTSSDTTEIFLGAPKSITRPTSPSTPNSSQSEDGNKHTVDYYSSLRGLNLSLLDALAKYIQDDPFVDIGEFLQRYKELRKTVQKNYDSKPPATVSTQPSLTPKPDTPKLSMPAPPSSFAGFGLQSKSPSTFGSSGSGPSPSNVLSSSATPASFFGHSSTTFSTTPSPFSFGAPHPAPSGSAPSSFFPIPSKDSVAPGGSVFPSSNTSSSNAPSSFFGSTSTSSSPFSFSATSNSGVSQKSVFGGGISSDGSGNSSTADKATASSPFGMPNPFGMASAVSGTTNTFGTFGGFSKSSSSGGSIGNPVGYGFGGSSAPGDEASTTPKPTFFSSGSNPSAFSGTGKTKSEDDASAGNDAGTDKTGSQAGESGPGSQGEASGEENAMLSAGFGVNPHDEVGEGEEMEDIVHQIKSKAYRLKKPDEKGAPGWAEIGYGILRLKKNRDTDSRRMLLRNSTTGKININFNIYSGLKPSQTKKAVTFIGHDDGVSQTYSVRLGTEQQAKELKEAMEREIAFVKAKEEP